MFSIARSLCMFPIWRSTQTFLLYRKKSFNFSMFLLMICYDECWEACPSHRRGRRHRLCLRDTLGHNKYINYPGWAMECITMQNWHSGFPAKLEDKTSKWVSGRGLEGPLINYRYQHPVEVYLQPYYHGFYQHCPINCNYIVLLHGR